MLDQLLTEFADHQGLIFWPQAPTLGAQRDIARQLLALANLDMTGTRRIIFGAEAATSTIRLHGLSTEQLQAISLLGRELPGMIEPHLEVTTVVAEVRGKHIAAFEISACANPPYVLCNAVAAELRTGACWVQDEEGLRPARRADLDRMYQRRGETAPVSVGLGEDADCQQSCLSVPDTSAPPSQQAQHKLSLAIDAKKTAAKLDCDEDTAMARLAHARIFGFDEPYLKRGLETLVESYNASAEEFGDEDDFYFFEQCAVKLNFSVRNEQDKPMDDAKLLLTLPSVRNFLVSERLYQSPGDAGSLVEQRLMGYPEVHCQDNAVCVQVDLGRLEPGGSQLAFETPLRIAVGPGMQGRKVAIKFSFTAEGLTDSVDGRLKLVFNRS